MNNNFNTFAPRLAEKVAPAGGQFERYNLAVELWLEIKTKVALRRGGIHVLAMKE